MKVNQKWIILSVALVLGLLSIPSASAFFIMEREFGNNIETQISESGKPDLTIQGIGYGSWGDAGQQHVVSTTIINIGNGNAIGEIDVKYIIKHLFSLIPVQSNMVDAYNFGLPPDHTSFYILEDVINLPRFGFFRVTCEVNPNRLIEESNYDNNNASQNFLVLFGYWLAIG